MLDHSRPIPYGRAVCLPEIRMRFFKFTLVESYMGGLKARRPRRTYLRRIVVDVSK